MLSTTQINALTPVLPFYFCNINNSAINPLGNGLINDTYLVSSPNATFVLQQINLHVFPNPEMMVQNAELIHQHLLNKSSLAPYPLTSIGHIKNNNGNCLTVINDKCWRAIDYVADTYTINTIENTQQAAQAAEAFATFTANLSDFDATLLVETIPNFHKVNTRLKQLEQAIKGSNQLYRDKAQPFITFINSHLDFVKKVNELSKSLPTRVTHNDTKINNLLFCNISNKAKAVIDLDTCMPGFLMNDFGDLVRTTCTNIDENNKNIADMVFQLDFFKVITTAYLNVFKNNITHSEKESLVVGAQLLPYMLAIRFLTDYLNGSVYFHTEYEDQNIDRVKNQLHLFELIKSNQKELLKIVFESPTRK